MTSLCFTVWSDSVAVAAASGEVEAAVARLASRADGSLHVERSVETGLVRFLGVHGGLGLDAGAGPSAPAEERARVFLASAGRAFGILRTAGLQTLRVSGVDAVGMQHVRFQQTHAGLRIAGAELIVHLRGSRVVAVNGRTLDAASLEATATAPTVASEQAAAKARERVVEERKLARADAALPVLELLNRGLLEGRAGPTQLAWFVRVHAPRVLEYVWIDARTGETLLHFNQQPDARDRRVYTAGHHDELPGTLVRAEGDPPSGDAELDAAYVFAGDTYDYLWGHFGRDSIDGAGQPLVVTVYYREGYRNAFWSRSLEQVVFGDGAAVDDVVGHEIAHGLTQHTADLYYYRQSGALNESVSDIFGETVDLWNGAGNDSPEVRWRIAEDWTAVGTIRDMMNPNAFGDPAKLSDPLLDCSDEDEGGVHTNSGLLNHAYALAADGGTYNGRTVAGIGFEKASAVVYRALTTYLTAASSFADADSVLRQSCQDLIGWAGILASDCEGFGRALDAVEMGQSWPCGDATVTVGKHGAGMGRVASYPPGIDCGTLCQGSFVSGGFVSLTAEPSPGSVFAGWDGACTGVEWCAIRRAVGQYSVSARFDPAGTTYPVSVTVSGTGTVTSSPAGISCGAGGECAREFPSGSLVTLTARPPAGWTLRTWEGDCAGRTPCTLAIGGPRNVRAVFVETRYIEVASVPGVYTGKAAWGDYDGDGDLDLMVGGDTWGARPHTAVYLNDGGAFVDAGISMSPDMEAGAWGDYDNDGDLDLLVTGWHGGELYQNDSGTMTRVPTAFDDLAGGTPAWGDFDNDGDLDLAVAGAWARWTHVTRLYRNDRGTLVDSGTPLAGVDDGDLAWGDYDRDGDLDLVVAGEDAWGGLTVLYRNDRGVLVQSDAPLPGVRNGSVAWADYDGDGDLDLALAGSSASGPLTKVFRNDAGVLTDSGMSFVGIFFGSARWGDYDGDGDPDLMVVGLEGRYPDISRRTRLYRNDGTAFTEVFAGLPEVSGDVAWGDYDGDGRLDLVLLGANGTAGVDQYVGIFHNTATPPNAPPQAPGDPTATSGWDGVVLEWASGSDDKTPAGALSYNVRVGTTPAGSEIVSPAAEGASGYRRLAAPGNAGESTRLVLKGLPPGQYHWAVQAIDTSLAGSPFTAAAPFIVVAPRLSFHTVAPCRVLDTRGAAGPYGGPALAAGRVRVFPIRGRCGIPTAARAVAANLTVTEPTATGHLTVYRGDGPASGTSSINYSAGQTRANNAVVALSGSGDMAVQAQGHVHFILDVTGYYQ